MQSNRHPVNRYPDPSQVELRSDELILGPATQGIPRLELPEALAWITFILSIGALAFGLYQHPEMFASQWSSGFDKAQLCGFIFVFFAIGASFAVLGPRWFLPALTPIALAYTVFRVGVLPLAASALFILSAATLGLSLLRFRHPTPRTNHDFSLGLVLGISLQSTLVGHLIGFPIHYPAVYLVLLAAPLAWGWRSALTLLQSTANVLLRPAPISVAQLGARGLLVFVLFIHLINTLRPEAGFDALAVHLVIPHTVSVRHFWPNDYLLHVWAVMPKTLHGAFCLTYLLGGEFAARMINTLFFVIACVQTVAVSRRLASDSVSFLTVAMMASIPFCLLTTSALFTDTGLLMFTTASVLALVEYYHHRKAELLTLAAVLFGTALSVKHQTLIFAPLFGLAVLGLLRWRSPVATISETRPHPLRILGLCSMCILVFGLVPYLDAFIRTGNPVFPYFNGIFQSPYYSSAANFDNGFFKTPASWRTPYDIIFNSIQFLESYNGAGGLQFLLLLPASVVLTLLHPKLGPILALTAGVFIVTAMFKMQSYLRYVLPTVPLFAVVIAYGLQSIQRRAASIAPLFSAVSVGCVLANVWLSPVANGGLRKDFPLLRMVTETGHVADLEVPTPERRLIRDLNRRYGQNTRVLFWNTHIIGGLDGQALVPTWHAPEVSADFQAAAKAEDYLALIKKYDVTHIMVRRAAAITPLGKEFIANYLTPEFKCNDGVVFRLKSPTSANS